MEGSMTWHYTSDKDEGGWMLKTKNKDLLIAYLSALQNCYQFPDVRNPFNWVAEDEY